MNINLKDNFYELIVYSSDCIELFLDLVFSLGVECVEEGDNFFIIRDEDELDKIEFGLLEYAKHLSSFLNRNVDLRIEKAVKENKDWLDEYKKNVKPIELGNFYIHPSWEKSKNGLTNIVVDPALAFGSGHHESTSSCILHLQKYARSGMEAIDIGCGSGILSITLAKIGCIVDSCDTDEQAICSTKQNVALNDVCLRQIWTGSISNLDKKYDFVVANIIADVILMLRSDLLNLLKDGSYLVLAGVLNRYEERILQAFSSLKLVENVIKNDWKSFVFQK
ncbi:MAG: 50S ribosomal protein L11 methyltransferase [Campylobacter sp.]